MVFNANFNNISAAWVRVRVVVFNATFNNISDISWRPVLLAEETGVTNYLCNQCLSPLKL
jgi:hypothetical protein